MFYTNLLFAQTENYISSSVLTASLYVPSIQYEKGLQKNNSLFLGFNEIPNCYTSNLPKKINVIWGSSVFLDYRKYYNFEKRLRKNKRTENNSGNFLGIRAAYNFPNRSQINQLPNHEIIERYFLGGLWGFQRNYNSGIHLSLSFAVGAFYRENKISYGLNNVDFKIGYVLRARE